MVDKYNGELLRIAIAQICQTIGYNSTQSAPLELLQDLLNKFLLEFTRDLHRKVELANRVEANLADTLLSMKSLNINIYELLDYITNVEPVQFALDVPKYPAKKCSNLNFLKPDSNELLTRPQHIYGYLPPTTWKRPANVQIQYKRKNNHKENDISFGIETTSETILKNGASETTDYVQTHSTSTLLSSIKSIKFPTTFSNGQGDTSSTSQMQSATLTNDEGRPTREVNSVEMTASGFITPTNKGKLAEAIIPDIIAKLLGRDALPSTVPTPSSTAARQKPPVPTDVQTQKATFPATATAVKPSPMVEFTKYSLPDANVIRNSKQTNISEEVTQFGESEIMQRAQNKLALKSSKKGKRKQNSIAQIGGEPTVAPTFREKKKSHRKAIKMLQKLSKSGKKVGTDNSKTKLKDSELKVGGQINPNLISKLQVGSPERLHLEKYLKKQAKQKQKHMKKKIVQSQKTSDGAAYQENPDNRRVTFGSGSGNATLDQTLLNPISQLQSEDLHITRPAQSDNNELLLQAMLKTNPVQVDDTEKEYKSIMTSEAQKEDLKSLDTKPEEAGNYLAKKLSNEPDRSKLNIFKKISKQKTPKLLSPTTTLNIASSASGSGEKQPLISLPSGTTITPTVSIKNDTKIKNIDIPHMLPGSVPGSILGSDVISNALPPPASLPDPTKPKKRGRKPGSKNQVKNLAAVTIASSQPKRSNKQNKTSNRTVYGPNMQLPITSPLNLTSHNTQQPNLPMSFDSLSPALLRTSLIQSQAALEPPIKQERKKYKSKNHSFAMPDCNNFMLSGGTINDQMQAINKSLLSVDTVIKPSAALLPSNLLLPLTSSTKTKSTSGNAKKPRIAPSSKQLQKASSNLMHNLIPSDVATSSPSSFQPNRHPHMLPMLPLYPFPSRPGLIPSMPGLFSSTFHNPDHAAAASATNLGIPFLPYPTVNAASSLTSSKPSTHDGANANNILEIKLEQDKHRHDTSYFNNSPLERDAMMLAAESTSGNDYEAQSLPKSGQPQEQTTSTKTEVKQENLLKNFSMQASQILESTNIRTNVHTGFKHSTGSQPNMTSTGNADDPIEVSDDSGDSHVNLNPSHTAKNVTSGILPTPPELTVFPPVFANSFKQPNQVTDTSVTVNMINHEIKKNKKQNKVLAKQINQLKSAANADQTPLILDAMKNSEKLSLAGGADLIPLAPEHAVYLPPQQLGDVPSSLLPAVSTIDSNLIFDGGVTITSTNTSISAIVPPAQDSKKRSKEHKKLKKHLKGERIKKKKLKKDKTKSKDKPMIDNNLYATDKINKELEKKLRKEKKREKQRLLMGPMFVPDAPVTSTAGAKTVDGSKQLSRASDESNQEMKVVLNIPNSTLPKAEVSPNQMPKLTLKLGGNNNKTLTQEHFNEEYPDDIPQHETRGQSPELARFSPLVTRPPKQKFDHVSIASNVNNDSESIAKSALNAELMVDVDVAASTPSAMWPTGGTLSASSVLLPQQLLQSVTKPVLLEPVSGGGKAGSNSSIPTSNVKTVETVQAQALHFPETNRPSSYVDAEGNRIWICPACGKVDDGSPMIGCDGCDAWYHWVCVGIYVAPKDNEDWFCRVCITRKKVHGPEKKRRRNKKK